MMSTNKPTYLQLTDICDELNTYSTVLYVASTSSTVYIAVHSIQNCILVRLVCTIVNTILGVLFKLYVDYSSYVVPSLLDE